MNQGHHAEGLDSHLSVISLMKKMTIFPILSQGGGRPGEFCEKQS